MKIIFKFLILLPLLFGIIYAEEHCPFCDKKVVEYQKFYEDDLVVGLYNYKPYVEGHCLIVPKRHVVRFEELTQEEIVSIFELIKKTHDAAKKVFQAKSYVILQKNGEEAGQSVLHVHFHYIPEKEGQSSFWVWVKLMTRSFISFEISSDEMRRYTDQMSNNLDSITIEISQ
ncbi:MAG: HIT family protein [Chlamydiae bacterium]|nr:HIT family protein [Chlamydiota bacterium]